MSLFHLRLTRLLLLLFLELYTYPIVLFTKKKARVFWTSPNRHWIPWSNKGSTPRCGVTPKRYKRQLTFSFVPPPADLESRNRISTVCTKMSIKSPFPISVLGKIDTHLTLPSERYSGPFSRPVVHLFVNGREGIWSCVIYKLLLVENINQSCYWEK